MLCCLAALPPSLFSCLLELMFVSLPLFFIFPFSSSSSPPCLLSLSWRPLRAPLLRTTGSMRAAQPAVRIQCQIKLLFRIFPGLLLSEMTLAEVFIGFLPGVTRSCFRNLPRSLSVDAAINSHNNSEQLGQQLSPAQFLLLFKFQNPLGPSKDAD